MGMAVLPDRYVAAGAPKVGHDVYMGDVTGAGETSLRRGDCHGGSAAMATRETPAWTRAFEYRRRRSNDLRFGWGRRDGHRRHCRTGLCGMDGSGTGRAVLRDFPSFPPHRQTDVEEFRRGASANHDAPGTCEARF